MFSLGKIAAALQGEDNEDGEPETGGTSTKEGAARSLWGVASALSATVKQRTAELAASLQETDWRSELSALQQGVKEDTSELGHRAAAATGELTHRAKVAAEQLPSVMESLPERGAKLQARAVEAGHHLQQAGKSLGSLGQRLVVTTTDLFEQINEAVQAELQEDVNREARNARARGGGGTAPRYSRFDADVAAMQRDSGTYCDEPEDMDDFESWLSTFDLVARKPDVDALLAENTFMSELQARIVPLIVEYDAFWTRYFYRLHKLEQRHAQFAALTQRAEQAADEDEEVGWGSDEDEDQEEQQSVTTRGELEGSTEAGESTDSPLEEQPAAEATDPVAGPDSAADVEGMEEQSVPVAEESAASAEVEGEPEVPSAPKSDDAGAETAPADLAAHDGVEAVLKCTSVEEGTITASTASDGSLNEDGGVKEPWCVVGPSKQAAAQAGAVESPPLPADQAKRTDNKQVEGGSAGAVVAAVTAAGAGAGVAAEGSGSLSDFGADDKASGAEAATGDEDDWGEDVADWE